MNNDSPLCPSDKDRLGFTDFAHHLADVFLHSNLSGGLIVGLEGGWGCGKSSVANIALHKLEGDKDTTIRVVRFAPWIVGSRSELIQELFREFEDAASELLPYEDQDKTKNLLRQYARAAPLLAKGAEFAALAEPRIMFLAKFFRLMGDHASERVTPSLAKLNKELRDKFANLKHPVVVFIDDLDRLEPAEAAEVLRLVRAVANFPNVAYLLAYDPQHLAKCLERATGVGDGRAYLKKFVQASATVPVPMGVDLKAWLTEELEAIFDRTDMSPTTVERLNRATSCWCTEYVTTPRDVVRVSNALKVYLAPVADKVDPADGLFVQILRIFRPELHEWVERHATAKFAFDSNDSDAAWYASTNVSIEDRNEELARITGKEGQALEAFIHELREHLPALPIAKNDTQIGSSFEDVQEFSSLKRLWSANHFRLYFSFAYSSDAISNSELDHFRDQLSKHPEQARESFRSLCNKPRRQGGNKAEALLSRILERERDFSPEEVVGLLKVLSGAADEFAGQLEKNRISAGSPPSLNGDIVDVIRLVVRLEPEMKMRELISSLQHSDNLWWLSAIMEKAAQEHGFYGSSPRPVEQRFLEPAEFDLAKREFLKRMNGKNGMYNDNAKAAPYFLSIMCVWCFVGGKDDARQWVRSRTKDDGEFVELLKLMKSRSVSTYRERSLAHDYLAAEQLDMFFESVDAVRERLMAIESKESDEWELGNSAKRLRESISERNR